MNKQIKKILILVQTCISNLKKHKWTYVGINQKDVIGSYQCKSVINVVIKLQSAEKTKK